MLAPKNAASPRLSSTTLSMNTHKTPTSPGYCPLSMIARSTSPFSLSVMFFWLSYRFIKSAMLFCTKSVGADMRAPKTFFRASFCTSLGDETVDWNREASGGRLEGRDRAAASSSVRARGINGSSSGTLSR
jgi:hypothetical protein